jgi:hypothetical protein
MAGPSRTLKLKYLGDASQLSKTTKGAGKDVESLGERAKNFGKKAAVAFAAVGTAAIAVGRNLFQAFEEVSTANKRVEQIIVSMGNFEGQIGEVSKRLIDVAESTAVLTGVDRNLIKESQALLLTFDSVNKTAGTVGGVFDRATAAAVDLAAAGFGSVTGNATQLGKALEDPIKGLASLTRVGVTFTEEQRALIAALVESNQTLEAQDIILQAIERQVGGVAEATATGSARIAQSFGLLRERIATQLAPAFEVLIAKAQELIDKGFVWWQDNGDEVIETFRELGVRIREAYSATKDFVAAEILPRLRTLFETLEQPVADARVAFRDLRDALNDLAASTSGGNRTAFQYLLDWSFRLSELSLGKVLGDLTALARLIERIADGARALNERLPGGSRGILNLPSVGGGEFDADAFTRTGIPNSVLRSGQAIINNVTVNGAIDPEGTARTIRRVLEDSNRRVGAGSFL